ncbi:alpha/beta hydrolase [Rhizomicrobium electricum]|uniref:Esterase n=1 Tax=Rhizomicrobium electricum TaxID=480070 RepID=A0ABP3PTJ0_9PROT|nr:alpha/beta hydrolase-fold protein [Rhizomicrobium electricum]NIJ48922.1 enterochelin esterase-like enzyme [Rhizomicrobium electricum]
MRIIEWLILSALIFPAAAAPRGGLDDCTTAASTAVACRLPAPDAADVHHRLSAQNTAWWRDGDRFFIVTRAKAAKVSICCTFQAPMDRIPGTDDWTFAIKSPHLDDAIIDILVRPDETWPSSAPAIWHGPKAPAAPKQGFIPPDRLKTIEIDSPNLGEKRKIAIYLPPGFNAAKRYPVIYMADGQDTGARAGIAEALIAAGKLPPLALVGLYAGEGRPLSDNQADRRNLDYLLDLVPGDAFFRKHEAFLLNEVMPLAEKDFGASSDPADRLLVGQSSGATWAVDTALRHPQSFGRAAGLSICWRRVHDWGAEKAKLFLGGGLFESCGETTAQAAAGAKAAGETVRFISYASGHSRAMWDVLFADALVWAWGVN